MKNPNTISIQFFTKATRYCMWKDKQRFFWIKFEKKLSIGMAFAIVKR